MLTSLVVLTLIVAAEPESKPFTAPASPAPEYGHGLVAEQADEGWISLFDGRTTLGWKDAKVEGGVLVGGTTTTVLGPCELKAVLARPGKIVFGGTSAQTDARELRMRIDEAEPSPVQLAAGAAVSQLIARPLGLKPVFSGRDWTGWKIIDRPNVAPERRPKWTIEEEAICVVGGPGSVELQQQYGDMVLQLQVQTRKPLANGGVFFRSQPGLSMMGYEAQVFNACYDNDPSKPARYSTGAIDDRQLAQRLVSRDGRTFTMTVIAVGPHIATWVNGAQMVDWADTRRPHENPRSGLRVKPGTVQLQAHDPATSVSFKNIRISSLASDAP